MPEGIFKSVYAVSSEDPNYPASNLLQFRSGKTWRIKTPGEKSAYVVLQLDKSEKIIGIDIGNDHSAFIEVLVGKNACNHDEYKEILVKSSFMTPPESKNSTIINRVRCFPKDKLVASIAEEKWDLVKVVCTQPFNRNVKYGLGFIKVHVAATEPAAKEKKNSLVTQQFLQNKNIPSSSSLSSSKIEETTKLKFIGSFKIREDSPDSESESSIGLFKRWKTSRNNEGDSKISTAASIRDASTPSSLKKHENNLKPSKVIQQKPPSVTDNNQSKRNHQQIEDKPILDRNRNDLAFTKEDEVTKDKFERQISIDQERIRKEREQLAKYENKKRRKSEVEEKKNDDSVKLTKMKDNEKDSDNKKTKIDDKRTKTSVKEHQKKLTKTEMFPGTSNGSHSHHKKRPSSPSTSQSSPQVKKVKTDKPEKPRKYQPFDKLLKGVTLVISGIQNPDRANLRQKALELGAKYKPDWDNTCTHLICAFKNTPKYNQVKGHGKIIKRTWIEKCHSHKKRIPWRRFAIDEEEKEEPESEDEIYDISLKPTLEKVDEDLNINNKQIETTSNNIHTISQGMEIEEVTNSTEFENDCKTTTDEVTLQVSSSSDESDTEDELERVRNIQKNHNSNAQSSPLKIQNEKRQISPTKISQDSPKAALQKENSQEEPKLANSPTSTKVNGNNSKSLDISVFDLSTEEEEFTRIHKNKQKLDSKRFFEKMKFFIGNVGAIDEIKLKQFIKQYGGELVDSLNESDYAITKEPIESSSKFNGDVVTPLWVYECNDMECLIPTRRYRL